MHFIFVQSQLQDQSILFSSLPYSPFSPFFFFSFPSSCLLNHSIYKKQGIDEDMKMDPLQLAPPSHQCVWMGSMA